ncbi:site-2 protease family protein [Streptomyces sp. SID3343]|uniref:site-2 protease family protein n=1 Tax=Streptomyces sp. SID3343 TaxID=2690260 RepID=UPI0031F867A6
MTYREHGYGRPRGARDAVRHVRPSPVFLALVVVCAVSGWIAWHGDESARTPVFLMVISGWLVSLCLHEFAHAFAALASGDDSVVGKGYLTLDPLKYSDPLLSFVLPTIFVLLGGIPLSGGAVYLDRAAIRGRVRNSLVSAVGPLTNAATALVLALILASGAVDGANTPFLAAFSFLIQLQVIAAVLNLLPVPGLDGYGVAEPWLPFGFRKAVAPYAPYAILFLFALLWSPKVNHLFYDVIDEITGALDVSPYLASLGYTLFRFWT